VSVTEFDEHADLWQRAGIAVVSVASSRDALLRLFEAIHREAESDVPGHVIETGSEVIEAADGGQTGLGEDWP
jgi:uncharacterized protein YlxP (DUF503 family)